jgi:hypothetical protein
MGDAGFETPEVRFRGPKRLSSSSGVVGAAARTTPTEWGVALDF